MAHTPRSHDEKRPHPSLLPLGTKIGMLTPAGMAEGTVSSHDEGGWIYFNWTKRPPGQQLPGWGRSTHVINLSAAEKDAAHVA